MLTRSVFTRAPFGVATECRGSETYPARINVDLRGLPFELVSEWYAIGVPMRGADIRATPTTYDVNARGRCVAIVPDGQESAFRPMYIRVRYARP